MKTERLLVLITPTLWVKPMNNPCKESFDKWWYDEGSGMPPLPEEDAEAHVRRVCEIAWSNGAYKMLEHVAKAKADKE